MSNNEFSEENFSRSAPARLGQHFVVSMPSQQLANCLLLLLLLLHLCDSKSLPLHPALAIIELSQQLVSVSPPTSADSGPQPESGTPLDLVRQLIPYVPHENELVLIKTACV